LLRFLFLEVFSSDNSYYIYLLRFMTKIMYFAYRFLNQFFIYFFIVVKMNYYETHASLTL